MNGPVNVKFTLGSTAVSKYMSVKVCVCVSGVTHHETKREVYKCGSCADATPWDREYLPTQTVLILRSSYHSTRVWVVD